jgi:predicted enzyme related to lactoylglutathione lyase
MPVLGVGGVFVKSDDPDASKRWYQEVLGLELNSYGGFDFAHADAANAFGESARTIFARFEAGSDYFEPSAQPFMINLIVSDMDALLDRIKASGTELIGEPQSFDYGRFAWVMDPDDVKVELWEPAKPAA